MKKHLTFSQKLLVATTLFGMFFGAGNLIFPVHLGQLAGRNLIPATVGFIITAVGIPILGVAAIGNTHSDGLQALSNKVGKGYGYVFTCLLYLTIGPFFAIPRCASTSFTTGIVPLLGGRVSEPAALLVFSAVFFLLVLVFSLRPAGITVWIGKIINPLFLDVMSWKTMLSIMLMLSMFVPVLVVPWQLVEDLGAKVRSDAPRDYYLYVGAKKRLFSTFAALGVFMMMFVLSLYFGNDVLDILKNYLYYLIPLVFTSAMYAFIYSNNFHEAMKLTIQARFEDYKGSYRKR